MDELVELGAPDGFLYQLYVMPVPVTEVDKVVVVLAHKTASAITTGGMVAVTTIVEDAEQPVGKLLFCTHTRYVPGVEIA